MITSLYGPYGLGYSRDTMIKTKSETIKRFKVNLESLSCSDCRL